MSIEKLDFNTVTHEKIPYTLISTKVIQNITDPLAGFIWVYLSSLPPGWQVNKEHLKKHFKIGDDKLKNILAYLKRVNLIEYHRIRAEDGTLGKVTIHVLCGSKFIYKKQDDNEPSTTGVKTTRVENHTCGNPPPYKDNKDINKIKNKKDRRYIEREYEGEIKKPLRVRASKIDETFTPSVKHSELSVQLDLDLNDEKERFINYYLSTGKTRMNWGAAFTNWLKLSKSYKPIQKYDNPYRGKRYAYDVWEENQRKLEKGNIYEHENNKLSHGEDLNDF